MGNSSYFQFDDDNKMKYILYDRSVDIHNVVMDDHDGIVAIHDCCELWISMIIIDLYP